MSKNKMELQSLVMGGITIVFLLGACNSDTLPVWSCGPLNGREGIVISWICTNDSDMITPRQNRRYTECARFHQDQKDAYYCNLVSIGGDPMLDSKYEKNVFPLQHPHCETDAPIDCNTQISFEKHPLSKGTQSYLMPVTPLESIPTRSDNTCTSVKGNTCTFSVQF